MNKEQFTLAVEPWIEYWREPPFSKFQWQEWYADFSGWPEPRLTAAFRTWKTYGKKMPEAAHINEADKKNRIAYKASNGGRQEHRLQALTIEACERTLQHRLGLFPKPREGDPLPIRIDPIVTRALEIYKNHERQTWHTDEGYKRAARSAAFAFLNLEVPKQLTGLVNE